MFVKQLLPTGAAIHRPVERPLGYCVPEGRIERMVEQGHDILAFRQGQRHGPAHSLRVDQFHTAAARQKPQSCDASAWAGKSDGRGGRRSPSGAVVTNCQVTPPSL